jgi:hypothetical protein
MLFADTEIAKNGIEYVLDINSAEEPSQSLRRNPQFLRNHFFPPSRALANCTAQGCFSAFEHFALTFPRYQRWLAQPKINTRKLG